MCFLSRSRRFPFFETCSMICLFTLFICFVTSPLPVFSAKVFFLIFFMSCFNISITFAQSYDRANGHPPRIVDSEVTTLSAFAGQALTLPCMVSGKPFPETTWFKDGEHIGRDWKRFKQKQNSLRVRDIQLIDSGLYICQAVNGFGVKEVKIRLVVHDEKSSQREKKRERAKPTFSHPVKMRRNNYIKPQGGTVSFRCRARGTPKPQIRWYKDGNQTELIPSGGTIRPQWTLILRDIRQEDSGRYTCHVWNGAGEISFQYTLRVVGSTRHERPVILKPHPVNTTARSGEKTSLQCKVRSVIPPTVKWIKRIDQTGVGSFRGKWPNNSLRIDEKLYLILPPQQMIRLPDGSYLSKLVINEVKDDDAGMYVCVGANTMGYNFRYAHLTVHLNGHRNLGTFKAKTSFNIILGASIGAALCLFVVAVAVKCICRRNQSKVSKTSQASSDQTRSSGETSRLHVASSRSDDVAMDTSNLQIRDEDSRRLMQGKEKMNFVNPIHSSSGRESDSWSIRKPKPFSSCAPYSSDQAESDVASHRIHPPPPPPPSQYSRTSSWGSSSRVRGARYQHCHDYRSQSPHGSSLPSSHSHIYEDF